MIEKVKNTKILNVLQANKLFFVLLLYFFLKIQNVAKNFACVAMLFNSTALDLIVGKIMDRNAHHT